MVSDANKLHLEIVKLLMQVAFADHDVSTTEVDHILGLAKEAELSDAAIDVLRSCLEGSTRLPAPDLGFLREHREVALTAAKKMITGDSRVHQEEREVFAQIKELLG